MSVDDIVLIGGGGHAMSVADSILRSGKYKIRGYTDKLSDNDKLEYLGMDDVLPEIIERGISSAAICIGYLGNSNKRDEMFSFVKKVGFELPVIIDPSAVVSASAVIGEGTFIGKNVAINAHSAVGKMCIINTGAIVEHNSVVGDYSHIAVGTVLCGDVMIGHHVLVGANATVLQGVRIGNNCIVGAGTIVLSDVPDNTRVLGVWK